jgi:hypothetical protein
MRTLNVYGQYSILPNKSHRPGRHLFDKWHSHSAGLLALGQNQGASGSYYFYLGGQLKDGNFYAWICDTPFTLFELNSVFASFVAYQVPNYPGSWEGETFNALARASLNVKILESDLGSWLASH